MQYINLSALASFLASMLVFSPNLAALLAKRCVCIVRDARVIKYIIRFLQVFFSVLFTCLHNFYVFDLPLLHSAHSVIF